MQTNRSAAALRWASLAFIAGGSLMAVLWVIFTNVHGPTSYNLDRPFLGRGMFFWGSLLGGPPNLLVAAGLILLYPRLARGARWRARLGYGLAVFGLLVGSAIDLAIGALGPPFFVPVVSLGLILLALGRPPDTGLRRSSFAWLMTIGVLQAIAFAWALVPLEISDQVSGYRLYGLIAHPATGFGWVMLALSLQTQRSLITPAPARQ